MQRHIPAERHGYILQELTIGLLIFAVALVPILRGLLFLPRVGAALTQQASRECWRSATDQAVLVGIDPQRSPVLRGLLERGTPVEQGAPVEPISGGQLGRTPIVSRPGAPRIMALHQTFGRTAEPRAVPVGFEIGVGEGQPPRPALLPPLPPTKLPPPDVLPRSSTLPVALLVPRGPGLPYVAQITARAGTGGPAARVKLAQQSPGVQTSAGLGFAELMVDAVELAHRVQGVAWSEYAGDPATDTPIELGDGRTRWLHPEGDLRLHVFEPSERVPYEYVIQVGRPEFRVGQVGHESGATVSIDYASAVQVEQGLLEARIDFPETVRVVFGDQWSEVAPSFVWTFADLPGDTRSGDTRSVFTSAGRARWRDDQVLAADPVTDLAGLVPALRGTWTLVRQMTPLAPPERVTPLFDDNNDIAGSVDFRAPELGSVRLAVGRPEVNGVQTVGTVLTVQLIP